MTESYDFYHYLPVNDDAMRWGLYITGAGRGTLPVTQTTPRQRHPSLYDFDWNQGRTLPELQILLITQGKGLFESKKLPQRPDVPVPGRLASVPQASPTPNVCEPCLFSMWVNPPHDTENHDDPRSYF